MVYNICGGNPIAIQQEEENKEQHFGRENIELNGINGTIIQPSHQNLSLVEK